MDFPQGADLAAHRLIAGGGVEELERPLLTLDVITHAVDPRKTALADYLENLEAALEDVTGSVVGGFASYRGSDLGRVGFRERSAAALRRWQQAGAAPISGSSGVARDVTDAPDGVHQAGVQHVRVYLRREVKLLDVAHGVEPAPPDLVYISEQAVLPQDGGEVRRLLEVQIRHFLQGHEVRAREPVDPDHPDEGAHVLLHAADVGLGAGEQF